jgi:lysine 2,3-aminomutase
MRFATKGPAILPSKILTDHAWTEALISVVDRGRTMGKDVVLHTHFNSPNEITWITEKAMRLLFERGVFVRNQSVLIRGVNDDKETMRLLVKRLGFLNVHPYYVYMHDMVKGVEDLRTTIQTAIDIEKFVRGSTAGYNTPLFLCDAPGGGGKRDLHSFDYYDRVNGIAVYSAPSVKPGEWFLYYDPIDQLSKDAQARWKDPATQDAMVADAIKKAKG